MKTMIDYKKYENMSYKQLLNSLTGVEKKEQKISKELNDTRNLLAFLQSKVKENLDKSQFVKYKDSKSYKIAKQREALRTPQEQKSLAKEVEMLVKMDYDDAL